MIDILKQLRLRMGHYWGFRPWARHSIVLLVAGVVYVMIGVGYTLSKANETRANSLQVLLKWAPMEVWGSVFIFAGVLAMISSRWPPFTHVWGYVVLTGLSAGWGGVYLTGVIFYDSPTTNLSAALLWGLLSFMWWAIGGLINPENSAVKLGRR